MSARKDSKPLDPTPEAYDDDERDAFELSADENADLCAGCVKCCTYITVEIDSPRAAEEYDQWIWALYHENICLFVEKPEKWYLQVDTKCGKLSKQGRCSIYGAHPVLCRQYDARSCERRLPLLDIQYFFTEGEQLEAWIREKRPGHYKQLQRFRAQHPVGGDGTGGLVTIEPASRVKRSPASNGSRAATNGTRPTANGKTDRRRKSAGTTATPGRKRRART